MHGLGVPEPGPHRAATVQAPLVGVPAPSPLKARERFSEISVRFGSGLARFPPASVWLLNSLYNKL